MGQKQCDKCGEIVAEAKAFCPGCGSPFVAEDERKNSSEFEGSSSTIQFGQTMYNSLLADMGLNISEAPAAEPAKRIQVVTAVPSNSSNSVDRSAETVPAASAGATQAVSQTRTSKKGYWKWMILVAVLFLFGALLLMAAVIALYFYPAVRN